MDKVQKIREEVEMLFNHVKDSNFESDSGAFYYLKDLLDYIDSLQEEPVNEDLEKEVRKYAPIYYKDNDISKFARHFANWQKKQDDKLLQDHVVYKRGKESGMRYMKQLLMKDVIELPLYLDGDFLTVDYDFTESGYKVGDKVKMIIIKEE